MIQCAICERTMYQVIERYKDPKLSRKEQKALNDALPPIVFDAYCVACRGLFEHYVNRKGVPEKEVLKVLKDTYAPKSLKQLQREHYLGIYTGGIFAL